MNSKIYNITLRRIRSSRKAIALVGVSVFALGVAIPPASASTNSTNWPYTSSSTWAPNGYDVSYPQCTSTTPYSSGEFAMIGIDGGRPFNTNGCVTNEWGAALTAGASSISIYINTGYSGAYAHDITTNCANDIKTAPNPPYPVGSKLAQAWEIGCSEADFALSTAMTDVVNPNANSQVGGGMWWADVETGNSWSTNKSLNQATIQGVVTELATPTGDLPNTSTSLSSEGGLPVGIYSNTTFWNKIMGKSWSGSGSSADWVAGSSCSAAFDSSPVWVTQSGSTAVGDPDTACPVS
ncbi:MAG: hypothetical protein HKL81_01735 [Acidimicrobiaceae bacterium]|nr:hypothetical protein [Acidimicrobiaceae bacterium]